MNIYNRALGSIVQYMAFPALKPSSQYAYYSITSTSCLIGMILSSSIRGKLLCFMVYRNNFEHLYSKIKYIEHYFQDKCYLKIKVLIKIA